MNLTVNGRSMPVEPGWRGDTLLNWLRESQGLVGAKFGCGVGVCGACTVHLEGEPVRSCMVPLAEVGSRAVITLEGLATGERLHPVQRAWLEAQVPQCGYCQSGQIMSTVALLRRVPRPDDRTINEALAGNLCRCGTHDRIRAAVKRAAELST